MRAVIYKAKIIVADVGNDSISFGFTLTTRTCLCIYSETKTREKNSKESMLLHVPPCPVESKLASALHFSVKFDQTVRIK